MSGDHEYALIAGELADRRQRVVRPFRDAATLAPIEVDEAALGLDAVREVGPGGHFFGTAHTLERYETAFYAPLTSDWRNFEAWEDAGAPTAELHAHRLAKELIETFEPPPLDEAIAEELAVTARRRAEGGARS